MNKILKPKFAPLVATSGGLLGFFLRLAMLNGGTDAEGLYPPATALWIVLWIVSIAVPVLVILMTRPLKEELKYSETFPASIVSALGSLVGTVGFGVSAITMLKNNVNGDTITFIAGLIGLFASLMLTMTGYDRLKGRRPHFLCHISACLFMALRIFDQCKVWSNEPQIGIFLFPLLAQIVVMLAAYHLCAFDLKLGKRPTSLLWSLTGVYLCLVALPSGDSIFFGCMAVWLLTNICSLRPAKRPKLTPQKPENPVQAQLSSNDVSIDELKALLDEE